MSTDSDRDYYKRITALIVAATMLLTASFVGVIAVMSGSIMGLQGRVPWYLVIGAIAFVGALVLLENYGADGGVIIVTSLFTGLLAIVLVPLAVEGLYYAYRKPGEVVLSQLILYLFAAALIGTGVGYWGLLHWREFTGTSSSGKL